MVAVARATRVSSASNACFSAAAAALARPITPCPKTRPTKIWPLPAISRTMAMATSLRPNVHPVRQAVASRSCAHAALPARARSMCAAPMPTTSATIRVAVAVRRAQPSCTSSMVAMRPSVVRVVTAATPGPVGCLGAMCAATALAARMFPADTGRVAVAAVRLSLSAPRR